MENLYIIVPFMLVALAIIIVGLVYLVLAVVDYICGRSVTPVKVIPLPDNSTAAAINRLEQLATLERNARLSEKK